MANTPVTVNYEPAGEDWKVVVTAGEKERTAEASGLVAARDRAEEIVEELVPQADRRTVVHLLEGNAFDFTAAYLQARHGELPAGWWEEPAADRREAATESTEPDTEKADEADEAVLADEAVQEGEPVGGRG
ncbi:hypothetical protein GCM10012275_09760 [Longimycelium tulufanense]|uniref:Uncharacterized protein n=1 Tax=Longimycelium tulufanense TaxID=907463 RepID=A0A8J3C9T3_9PSEU|nr:hypothetical protein [Longimycelium tulufanense]GGM40845.1 hypothetical protein GCM10012275_09760 [Longimycelium tulufanense]